MPDPSTANRLKPAPTAPPPPDDLRALALLGVAAYVVAATIHEAGGHGLTCLATGGRIRLLTSVFFRSEPGSAWGGYLTDAAGPTANLLAGAALGWAAGRTRQAAAHLFLTLAMACNLAWGSGCLLYSAVTVAGDWAFVVRGWPHQLALRLGLAAVGIPLYWLMLRATAGRLRGIPAPVRRVRLLVPYLAAALAAAAAALAYAPDRPGALLGALQESALANAGLLWLALGWRPEAEPLTAVAPAGIRYGGLWAGLIGAGWLVFAATLGRGLVFP